MIPPGTILEGEPTLEFRSISRRNIPCVTFLSMIALTIMASGCDESLPPRDAPANAVTTSVALTSGEYLISIAEPHDVVVSYTPARLSVKFKNTYDDVLQDSVSIHGSVDIWDIDRPLHRASLNLSKAYISPSPTYPGDLITILPGSYAALGMEWNHMTTDASPIPFWTNVHYVLVRVDNPTPPFTVYYGVTDTIHLAIQAHVQVFASYGNVTSPVSYANFVYRLVLPLQN
jgi:hypothetical protein